MGNFNVYVFDNFFKGFFYKIEFVYPGLKFKRTVLGQNQKLLIFFIFTDIICTLKILFCSHLRLF